MKKVCNHFYVHKSNLVELESVLIPEDIKLLQYGMQYMWSFKLPYIVIKYDKPKHSFSFIQAHGWVTLYEPVVGDSYIFKALNESPIWKKGGTTVYHQKHTFVADDYNIFSIKKSEKRTKMLESISWYKENKSRIGSKRIWEEFLKEYNLPRYM